MRKRDDWYKVGMSVHVKDSANYDLRLGKIVVIHDETVCEVEWTPDENGEVPFGRFWLKDGLAPAYDVANKRLVDHQIAVVNKPLEGSRQKVYLCDEQQDESGDLVWSLKWDRPLDRTTEAEELVFSGDAFTLFTVLVGIEYGVRIGRITKT